MALEAETNLYKRKTVLVIGARGAGLSIAHHLHDNLDKATYLYDPLVQSGSSQKGITRLSSLSDVVGRKYDLIINSTPLGRYYFDKRLEAFTSPLDLETLAQVSHKQTVVQETNYLPGTTLLLQMARHLELQVVTGDLLLVFQAIESLRRYLGITLDDNTIRMLVDEISVYIAEREAAILASA
jgi:shikimate 5-dehydrogenase